jgi:hypothetical protein
MSCSSENWKFITAKKLIVVGLSSGDSGASGAFTLLPLRSYMGQNTKNRGAGLR